MGLSPIPRADSAVREFVDNPPGANRVQPTALRDPHSLRPNWFFKGSTDMLSIATFQGYLQELNAAWTSVLGFSEAELKEQPFFDFAHPEDRPAVIETFQRLQTDRSPLHFENRYRCKDGSYRWLAWAAAPVSSDNLLYVFAYDITERKDREAEIQQLNNALAARAVELEQINLELERQIHVRERAETALKETNAELEAFCYSVSHDLRAPLRAMQGFANALLEDCGSTLSDCGRDYANRIVLAANRMDSLVQDLLRYSRISYSALPLQSVDLRLAISEAVRQLEAPLAEARAFVWIHPPLPAIVGHYATVVQVVSNLLSNAIKFVPEGVQPHAAVSVDVHDETARIWVRDNGIGIASEFHSKIFRIFERLHGTEVYPGTGVGLAIVRKAAERMGGRTGVESSPGHGSAFWVELPLDRAETETTADAEFERLEANGRSVLTALTSAPILQRERDS